MVEFIISGVRIGWDWGWSNVGELLNVQGRTLGREGVNSLFDREVFTWRNGRYEMFLSFRGLVL